MKLPREVTIRCPDCGRERIVVLDLANEPPFWIFECDDGACGAKYKVRLGFDVELLKRRSRFFQPRIAN
jgi:hypothetical protein